MAFWGRRRKRGDEKKVIGTVQLYSRTVPCDPEGSRRCVPDEQSFRKLPGLISESRTLKNF